MIDEFFLPRPESRPTIDACEDPPAVRWIAQGRLCDGEPPERLAARAAQRGWQYHVG